MGVGCCRGGDKDEKLEGMDWGDKEVLARLRLPTALLESRTPSRGGGGTLPKAEVVDSIVDVGSCVEAASGLRSSLSG